MVKVIAGLMGSSVASGSKKVTTPDHLRSMLSLLAKHNITELDTARVYNNGKSEELLGEVKGTASRFAIATKAPAFGPGTLSYDSVISNCNASLAALKQSKIDLYYFHGPDSQTPLSESCRAIHELHTEGKFVRWGVSNLHADAVSEIVSICEKEGWIKPSVYQGES
jgi:aflatoxin B1 aldehyde reductase